MLLRDQSIMSEIFESKIFMSVISLSVGKGHKEYGSLHFLGGDVI